MTLNAPLPVVCGGLLPTWDIVGIMAGSAREPFAAFQETHRLPKSVCGTDDLELVFVAGARRMIEVDHVVAKRLARPIGVNTSP